MSFNLDPDLPADNVVYEQIRTLLNVDTDNDDINADPIFQAAQQSIEARLEIDDDNRTQARSALVFCYTADALEGGGKTTVSEETIAGGALKTVHMGPVSTTYTEGGNRSRSGAETDPEKRSAFFREKCEEILTRLGADPASSSSNETLTSNIRTTKSRL